MAFTMEDSKGRKLLIVNDKGQYAFSRFPDMDNATKDELTEIYESLSGESRKGFLEFLDFKGNMGRFCS